MGDQINKIFERYFSVSNSSITAPSGYMILLLVLILFVSGCATTPSATFVKTETILQNSKWAKLAESVERTFWYAPLSLRVESTGIYGFYALSSPKPNAQHQYRVGPSRYAIHCELNLYDLRPLDSKGREPTGFIWREVVANTVMSDIKVKICGIFNEFENATLYFVAMTSENVNWYIANNAVFLDKNNAIRTMKVYSNSSTQRLTQYSAELDCNEMTFRFGDGEWLKASDEKVSNEATYPSVAYFVWSRACRPDHQVMTILNTPGVIDEPKRVNLDEKIEAAKSKCIELGLAEGTEKFAECVLLLSK